MVDTFMDEQRRDVVLKEWNGLISVLMGRGHRERGSIIYIVKAVKIEGNAKEMLTMTSITGDVGGEDSQGFHSRENIVLNMVAIITDGAVQMEPKLV